MNGRCILRRAPRSSGRAARWRGRPKSSVASGRGRTRRSRVKGIILAAGKGSRLNGTIGDKPKCLLRVGGKTLVERQIDALRQVGIEDVAVVVGCQAEAVRRTCGQRITYIENARFAQTNSLYSLWLAGPPPHYG